MGINSKKIKTKPRIQLEREIIHQGRMVEKRLREINQKLLLMCYMLKKKICIVPVFQNTTQMVKNKLFF